MVNAMKPRSKPRAMSPLDQDLLLDILLVRMHAAFQWYGPSAWRDQSIYPAIAVILQNFGVERVALTPDNLIKRVGRLRKTINDIPREGSAAVTSPS